jgi:hypothetical protein
MNELDEKLYRRKSVRIITLLLTVFIFIFLSTKIHEYFHWAYAYYKGYDAIVQYGDLFGLKGWTYDNVTDRMAYFIGGLGTFGVMILIWFMIWIYPTNNTVPLELGSLIVAFANLFYSMVEGLFLGVYDNIYYSLKYPAYFIGFVIALIIYAGKTVEFIIKGEVI